MANVKKSCMRNDRVLGGLDGGSSHLTRVANLQKRALKFSKAKKVDELGDRD